MCTIRLQKRNPFVSYWNINRSWRVSVHTKGCCNDEIPEYSTHPKLFITCSIYSVKFTSLIYAALTFEWKLGANLATRWILVAEVIEASSFDEAVATCQQDITTRCYSQMKRRRHIVTLVAAFIINENVRTYSSSVFCQRNLINVCDVAGALGSLGTSRKTLLSLAVECAPKRAEIIMLQHVYCQNISGANQKRAESRSERLMLTYDQLVLKCHDLYLVQMSRKKNTGAWLTTCLSLGSMTRLEHPTP